MKLSTRLEEPAADRIRGGGYKQCVEYVTAGYENLIVAGRSGYVKKVEAQEMEPAAWYLLVAEVKFNHSEFNQSFDHLE